MNKELIILSSFVVTIILMGFISAVEPPQAFGCEISGLITKVTFQNESTCLDFNKWVGNSSICQNNNCCPEDVLPYTPAHYFFLVKVQSIKTIENSNLQEQERPGNHITRCEEILKVGDETSLKGFNLTLEPKVGLYVRGNLSNSYIHKLSSYSLSESPSKDNLNFFQRIVAWFKNLFS